MTPDQPERPAEGETPFVQLHHILGMEVPQILR